jgi:predicted transcriptional regulator of viral defense system
MANVEVAKHIDSVGGVTTSSELKSAGFTAGAIAYACETGSIDRLTRGVYCTPDVFEDDFAIINYRWRKCVFSHASALYLLGLSGRLPTEQHVTVPRGYNPRGLKEAYPGIAMHWVRPELYPLGETTARTPVGNLVRCYGAERSIADLIRQRKLGGADARLIRDAISGYFRRADKDLPRLAEMCEALGVRDEMQVYLEVL